MARSIWNGTITFGLVTVPIKVYTATESKTVHFNEVHAKDGARIEHRRIRPKDGKEIDYDDIVMGYEVSRGKWVKLTDEDIAAAAGSQSRRIEIDHFVPSADIDPDFYDRTYYLGTRDKGKDAYALLHAALEQAGRAGVGQLDLPQPRAHGAGPRRRRRARNPHDATRGRAGRPARLRARAGPPQAERA